MFLSLILPILFVKPLLASAIPPISTRQGASYVPGYQTTCSQNSAISFDDGPYVFSEELVDEVVSYGASGTMFVNGYNWGCIYEESNVNALRHAYESGFTIGSHTWNHYDITLGTIDDLANQLDLVETALWNILGVKPALFRPPYGSFTDDIVAYLNSRGYTVVGWSHDTLDSVGAPSGESEAILSAANPGDLFLAHETSQSTVEQVIPDTIPGLVARGINLVTVDQCLGVGPYQAYRGSYGVRDETWTCEGTPIPGQGFKRN